MNKKNLCRIIALNFTVMLLSIPITAFERTVSADSYDENIDESIDEIHEPEIKVMSIVEVEKLELEEESEVVEVIEVQEVVEEIAEKSAEKSAEVEEKKGKIGALDWFEEVQYILGRGTDAYITDVDTGESFWVKRTFGTNHADIEPLTKEDSEIIKEIWNGWSWDRRAVVVKVGAHIIAGAMSAMPHAGLDSAPAVEYVHGRSAKYGYGQNLDAVKNNGADGVMDLHFKNSRTHGTNRKQSSMQNMVIKAEQYINDMKY